MAENKTYNDSPTFIPGRLESSVHGLNPVADAKDIYDINHGKWQKDINEEIETVPTEIERIDGEIERVDGELGNRYTKSETDAKVSGAVNIEKQRAEGIEAGLRESIDELGQIGLDPENAISTDGDDFDDDTLEKRSKIPTIGSILDGADDEPTPGSEKLVKSGGIQNELALGAVYDVSAKNPTAGPNNDGKFESLSALLSDANLNTLIPTAVRKGGMTIKFVQSSDNKYVQARCMAQNFTTDITHWVVADEGVYVENPEFVYVKTDSKGKILWAIRTDGDIFYGAGCPPQVQEYVQAQINEIGIDALLATKVDKVVGKSLIDAGYASSQETIESPEYMSIESDIDGRILCGRKKDGTRFENMPFENPSSVISYDNNPEWIDVKTDKNGRIVEGIKKNGKKSFPAGIEEIDEEIELMKNEITEIGRGVGKNIRLLVFGNSLTQDAINYVPWMLSKLCPELTFTIVDYYVGGATLEQQLIILNGGTIEGKMPYVYSSNNTNIKWSDVTSSKDAILAQGFDHITIQEYTNNASSTFDSTSYLGIVQKLQELCGAAKFHHLLDKTITGNTSLPDKAKNFAVTAYRTMPVSTIVNPGMAFDNAYNTPELNSVITGDSTYSDVTHAEEGLPCYIEALVMAQWIMGLLGIQRSVMDDSIILNAVEYAKIGVTGANVGSNGPIFGTTEEQRLAQKISIKTYKQSFSLQEMKPLNPHAMATWVDDDGIVVSGNNQDIIHNILPISESNEILVTFGVLDLDGDNISYGGETLTKKEFFQTMQSKGNHITSHPVHTYWYGNDYDLTKVEPSLIENLILLRDFFHSDLLIYPGSSSENAAIVDIVRKWCVCGVKAGLGLPNHLGDNTKWQISRTFINLESCYNVHHNDSDWTNAVNWYKKQIDDACDNGDWIIFGTHSWGIVNSDDTSDPDVTTRGNVRTIIEYAISKGIKFHTLWDAYNRRSCMYNFNEMITD